MPKVKKEIGYNAIFPTRLRQAMEEKGVTYQDLALAAGVRRQAVGQWCLGNTAPDVISLEKITRLLGVSADYLIGLSDVASFDVDLKAVCAYTGLSEKACSILAAKDRKGQKKTIKDVPQNARNQIYELWEDMENSRKADARILSYFIEHGLNGVIRRIDRYKKYLQSSTEKATRFTKEFVECCQTGSSDMVFSDKWNQLAEDFMEPYDRGRLEYYETQDAVKSIIDDFVREAFDENKKAIETYRQEVFRRRYMEVKEGGQDGTGETNP